MKEQQKYSAEEIWLKILEEIEFSVSSEPKLANYLTASILSHGNLSAALANRLANKLASSAVPSSMLLEILAPIIERPTIVDQAVRDLQATVERDSACQHYSAALLYFKGFLSLQAYRVANVLWRQGRTSLALLLQHRISIVFAVDIHPAATIGGGVMIDHATGLVVGETTVIEDCVSLMQGVTLGGTGKDAGDRHPKIRQGVLIGPGATVLGNIEVGEGAMVSAGSVVLKNVSAHKIVAGVPAREVGDKLSDPAAREMNHCFIEN